MQAFDQTTVPLVEVMTPGGHMGYTRIDTTYMPAAHLQPAGGQGPISPMPVSCDELVQAVRTTNQLLRELMELIAVAMG